jgi:BRCA1 C Terminus (BRCT) domain
MAPLGASQPKLSTQRMRQPTNQRTNHPLPSLKSESIPSSTIVDVFHLHPNQHTTTTVQPMPPSSKNSRSSAGKKRKRNWSLEAKDEAQKPPIPSSSLFAGMTVAISTLVKDDDDDHHAATSYQKVAELARSHGAKVSGQVHSKVHCVLCTPAALEQATQRVRKAKKKQIPLVDGQWLYECIQQAKKIPWDKFLWKYPEDDPRISPPEPIVVNSGTIPETKEEEDLPDTGWTEPVDVGCCCVCHENGDTDCEWCVSCSVNTAAKNDANQDKRKEEEEDDNDAGWSKPVDVGCCCVCHENGDADCEWCVSCSVNTAGKKDERQTKRRRG